MPVSASFLEDTSSRDCSSGPRGPYSWSSFSTYFACLVTPCFSFLAVKTSRWLARRCPTSPGIFMASISPAGFYAKISLFCSNASEPFQINLTASCNFGCECDMNDVQPVCGANGLTYFSPCHAGCTSLGANSDNYTNCACKIFCQEFLTVFDCIFFKKVS